jgi:hypothetical protein
MDILSYAVYPKLEIDPVLKRGGSKNLGRWTVSKITFLKRF